MEINGDGGHFSRFREASNIGEVKFCVPENAELFWNVDGI